jgi:enoyl-CoA hydratase
MVDLPVRRRHGEAGAPDRPRPCDGSALTGRLVDAAFAERIGLVNRVVERDRLMAWALETAAAIAANSPSAVQAVRTQISASIADYAKSREALEQQLGDRVRAGPHFAEGVAAFREKRKPDYR